LSIQWKRNDSTYFGTSNFVMIRMFFAISIQNFTCLDHWIFLSQSNELRVVSASLIFGSSVVNALVIAKTVQSAIHPVTNVAHGFLSWMGMNILNVAT
jgi:hypothetical protein